MNEKEFLTGFWKHLEANNMFSGTYGAITVIDSFLKKEKSALDNSALMNLEVLPCKIRDKELELIEMNLKLEENKVYLAIVKDAVEFEIYQEVGEDGKKKYTNDTQRTNATKDVLKLNSDYNRVLNENIELNKRIKTETIQLEFLKRIFRAAEAMSRLEE